MRLHWTSAAIRLLTCLVVTVGYLILSLLYPWRAIVPFDAESCLAATTTTFPKVIHRIWDKSELPERYQDYLNTCRLLNSDYEVHIWNPSTIERFLKAHYLWGLDLYNQYERNESRYDAARYFIIHHFGGIYLDMDMNCSKSFDSIISSVPDITTVILGEAFPVGVVSNFMMAKPESQFFTQVIHNLINTMNETFFISLYETFVKTGPIFLWKNYLNFPCEDQIFILEKYKIRREWLSHDGAATWQRGSGFYIMAVSNACAALIYVGSNFFISSIAVIFLYFFIRTFYRRQVTIRASSEYLTLC